MHKRSGNPCGPLRKLPAHDESRLPEARPGANLNEHDCQGERLGLVLCRFGLAGVFNSRRASRIAANVHHSGTVEFLTHACSKKNLVKKRCPGREAGSLSSVFMLWPTAPENGTEGFSDKLMDRSWGHQGRFPKEGNSRRRACRNPFVLCLGAFHFQGNPTARAGNQAQSASNRCSSSQ